jgi:hypothetical protein
MALRLLAVILLLSPLAFSQDTWTGVGRVVAVGDIHGDLGQFTMVLRQAGVIDDKNRWSGGSTHLVQLGDIADMGPDTLEIFELLMQLEKQAKKAGGEVHALIGDHDAMNMYGDLRFVTPEEFKAFERGGSKSLRRQAYEMHIAQEAASARGGSRGVYNEDYKIGWENAHPLGFYEHRNAYHARGDLGRWIRKNNTIIKIDDTLFVHGGISPRYANWDLYALNQQISAELNDPSMIAGGVAVDESGPLGYAGLAYQPEERLATHVDALLAKHDAKRIVIGHTPTIGTVMPRFGGKVLMVDVGLSAAFGARASCLVIEEGQAYTMHRGQRLELPADDSSAELLRYLSSASAANPGVAALRSALTLLESGTIPNAAASQRRRR